MQKIAYFVFNNLNIKLLTYSSNDKRFPALPADVAGLKLRDLITQCRNIRGQKHGYLSHAAAKI